MYCSVHLKGHFRFHQLLAGLFLLNVNDTAIVALSSSIVLLSFNLPRSFHAIVANSAVCSRSLGSSAVAKGVIGRLFAVHGIWDLDSPLNAVILNVELPSPFPLYCVCASETLTPYVV